MTEWGLDDEYKTLAFSGPIFLSYFNFLATLREVWHTFLASHRKHHGTLHLEAVIPNNRSSSAPKLHTDIHSEVFNVDSSRSPETSLGASQRLPRVVKQWKSHAEVSVWAPIVSTAHVSFTLWLWWLKKRRFCSKEASTTLPPKPCTCSTYGKWT